MGRGLVVLLLLAPACAPSQECIDYVACQKAYDDEVVTADYEAGGACWGLSLQTADACTAQCIVALDALAQLPDPPSECVRASP